MHAGRLDGCHPGVFGYANVPREDSGGYDELLECTRKVCGDVQIIDHRDSILWTDLGSALLKAIRESLPALGLHALCTVHLEKAVFEAHRSTKKMYRESIFCDELW